VDVEAGSTPDTSYRMVLHSGVIMLALEQDNVHRLLAKSAKVANKTPPLFQHPYFSDQF
jgi:hypothetical protein